MRSALNVSAESAPAMPPMAVEPRKMPTKMRSAKAAAAAPPSSAAGWLKVSTVRARTMATASLSTLSPKTIAKMSSRTPVVRCGDTYVFVWGGLSSAGVRSVPRRRARSLQMLQRGRSWAFLRKGRRGLSTSCCADGLEDGEDAHRIGGGDERAEEEGGEAGQRVT